MLSVQRHLCKNDKDDAVQRARTVPSSVSVICAVIECEDLRNNHRVESFNMDEVSSLINNLLNRKSEGSPRSF